METLHQVGCGMQSKASWAALAVCLAGTVVTTWVIWTQARAREDHVVSFVIGGGLLISLLVFGITRSLGASPDRAVALAKQMTEQLRLQERAIQSASDGIFILDARRAGRPIIYANPAFIEITGYSLEEGLGQDTTTLRRADAPPSDLLRLRAALKAGNQNRIVLHERRKDGSPLWAELRLSPVRDDHGQVTHFLGVLEDITESKQDEQALQESQERFALAVQGASDGIWDWNVTTNAVYFSPRWKSMLGYEEHEIEDAFSGWERLLHPEDRERALTTIQAYFSGASPIYELEHRLRHKDGSYRWILARGLAVRDAKGRPVRMAGSHVDLTERKLTEEKLRAACAELAQSQADLRRSVEQLTASKEELERTQLQLIQAAKLESIGTLAAGVAHEVKNPLQTILMGVELLSNNLPGSNEMARLALAEMRDAVKRANGIIRELLQLSAVRDLELKEEDLNEVVERSLWLLNHELVVAQIDVVRHLQAPLPRVRIDRGKIEQVLLNLFINALQAMPPKGTLSVTTRSGCLGDDLVLNHNAGRLFRSGETLVVAEVRDTGPGIPEPLLARLFDPFFTTKPVGVGTGLGLSVVKKIIDLHDASIEIQNAAEGGASVTLVLRAQEKATV